MERGLVLVELGGQVQTGAAASQPSDEGDAGVAAAKPWLADERCCVDAAREDRSRQGEAQNVASLQW